MGTSLGYSTHWSRLIASEVFPGLSESDVLDGRSSAGGTRDGERLDLSIGRDESAKGPAGAVGLPEVGDHGGSSRSGDREAELRDRLERPLRDLRISVTDRCNFRCPYCMPAEIFGERYEFLPRKEILRFEEIERLVRLFVGFGVEKLRITGGEPLLRHGLHELIAHLTALAPDLDIAITTNGSLLPRWAAELKRAGLRRVTVSLDSLDPEIFRRMNGERFHVERVLEGIAAAEEAGFLQLKINCVVQRGVNDHAIVDLARHFHGTGHILRFIEFMDVGTRNQWKMEEVVPGAEIVERIGREMPLEPIDPNYAGEVASRWRYVDGGGEIGMITSVSSPFCGDCTRARLTTEGALVTCLFADGGIDLREPMRAGESDDALRELIASTWKGRKDRYSEERSELLQVEGRVPRRERVEMYQIGG
ncbi:MAG: GTP 3',8-cyclase MoaA [Deltaproteobacteria bacterium]|nr:GTP 3',8-cyclase MoaA [Deltaproteobacteria bacterium]